MRVPPGTRLRVRASASAASSAGFYKRGFGCGLDDERGFGVLISWNRDAARKCKLTSFVGNLVLMRLSLTLALLGDWVKTRKEPTELLQFIYLLVVYLEYST